MKKFMLLTSMILACVAFSAADSTTITNGYGTLSGTFLATDSFNFSGAGAGISVPGALNDIGPQGDLVVCNPCDPRTTNLELLRDMGITILQGNRFVQGSMAFDAVSFSSSLAPNGMLIVDYRATANLSLNVCVGDPLFGCFPTGPLFVSNPNQLWYVRATFTPFNGQYIFDNAIFSTSPVPEPSTMLLLGTGLMGVIRIARRKRSG
jgi:hypothetical protein